MLPHIGIAFREQPQVWSCGKGVEVETQLLFFELVEPLTVGRMLDNQLSHFPS
jgi:hypothetical protein